MVATYVLERVKSECEDRRGFSRREYTMWLLGTARNAIVVVIALCVARVVSKTVSLIFFCLSQVKSVKSIHRRKDAGKLERFS